MLAFYAQEVEHGEGVELRPPEEYVLNITQVALTPKAQGIGSKIKATIDPTVLQIVSKDINGEQVVSTVCTLDHTCRQATVNLTFGWDEIVTFRLAEGGGKGPVSISGFLQPSPDEEDELGYRQSGEYSSDDEEDEEDDDEELDPRVYGMNGEEEDDDEEDDDEDEDDEDEDEDEDDEDEAPMLESASKRKRSFDVIPTQTISYMHVYTYIYVKL
jgi:hypothetical protein